MLNICCIREGNKYPAEYVDILFDMVRRNLPEGMEGRFVCFTNQTDELHPEIIQRPIPSTIFEPSLFPDGDRIFYLELETCIVGPLDKLVGQSGNVYCGEGAWPLAVAIWYANNAKHNGFHTWEKVLPGVIEGYDPKGFGRHAKVVTFSPECPPSCCGGWVKQVWKIGGGTSAELSFICNVPPEEVMANIRSACARRPSKWVDFCDPHNGTACIVAGGPSLARELFVLRALKDNGAHIFAANNVPNYLAKQGIIPHSHVLLDALPWVADYVAPKLKMTRYYASQCHPTVLDMAGEDLVMWHPSIMGIEDVVPEASVPYIGGGTTVATRTIALAYLLGYRKFHLFGMDSSFEGEFGENNHAYDQLVYESALEVTCGERKFLTSPQLLGQAQDFRDMAPDLLTMKCEIFVHGSGLIAQIAHEMMKQ